METVRLHRFKHGLLPCPWILFFLFFYYFTLLFQRSINAGISPPGYDWYFRKGGKSCILITTTTTLLDTFIIIIFLFFLSKAVSASQALQG